MVPLKPDRDIPSPTPNRNKPDNPLLNKFLSSIPRLSKQHATISQAKGNPQPFDPNDSKNKIKREPYSYIPHLSIQQKKALIRLFLA